jgi:protein-L-isoaspartate(D-aspartate) O-methyltransferase
MKDLIQELIEEEVLKSPRIIAAFQHIDRADFVPDNLKDQAYINAPLPIGHGQTISQPLTVAFMLELLEPEAGQKILDIGSGSGWQTALLADIVSDNVEKPGHVFALELIPELHEQSIKNISKYNFISKDIATMLCANAEDGLPKGAPFDRIIAGAATKHIPSTWKKQLQPGGILVVPIGTKIQKLKKVSDSEFVGEEYPGFAFVPFIHNGDSSTPK